MFILESACGFHIIFLAFNFFPFIFQVFPKSLLHWYQRFVRCPRIANYLDLIGKCPIKEMIVLRCFI